MSCPPSHGPRLTVSALEDRLTPSTWVTENFDTTPTGTLPTGWDQWSSAKTVPYAVSTARPQSGPNGLAVSAPSNVTARSFATDAAPADTAVRLSLYVDNLHPLELITRGQDLNTTTPTYYAASVTRGTNIKLLKVENGVTTVLGNVTSTNWVSNTWLRVSLIPAGDQLQVEVYNPATTRYLSANGTWQDAATHAISVTDGAITAAGQVGVGRPSGSANLYTLDDFSTRAPVSVEPPPPPVVTGPTQSFDTTAVGAIPSDWSQFGNFGPSFAVHANKSLSPSHSLATSGDSRRSGFAWMNQPMGPDVTVSASVLADSLIPVSLVARGQNLNSRAPTYYGVVVNRGMRLTLVRVTYGITAELGTIASTNYFSNQWVRVTLSVEGSALKVKAVRTDTNQTLQADGTWGTADSWALQATDSTLPIAGVVGVGRTARYAGVVSIDDFTATDLTTPLPQPDVTNPTLTVTSPANNATVSGTLNVQATASDNVAVARVEFWLNGTLRSTATAAPYAWAFDTTTVPDGLHAVTVRAFDAANNLTAVTREITVDNVAEPPPPAPTTLPQIPRHYDHIRVAQLAYAGTPITSFELGLLEDSVDLVIPNPQYLQQIENVAPDTPQLIYTNLSNLYQGLITDWSGYADANGLDREAAYYHVSQSTHFTGSSPSSQPVEWFWNVRKGGTDLTWAARNTTPADTAFGDAAGETVVIGFPEQFRELRVELATPAANGWAGVIEYATAVNAAGTPTAWAALPILADGSTGFTQSGTVTFDPPGDWTPAAIGTTDRLYYVRVRTTTSGTTPVLTQLLGRDYVGAQGQTTGFIPAFDTAADANGDGYLNDAEYANRTAGLNARFRYESRLFYPYYGQMRFVTNPAGTGVAAWAADFHQRILQNTPLADGFFVDNSNGKPMTNNAALVETVTNASYATAYGQMLEAVNAAIAPKWLMANTSGGNAQTTQVVSRVPASFEEFQLRPLANNYVQFYDNAGLVNARLGTANTPYLVLDSHPMGGSPTDGRTQLATLAYYYLLADPTRTFLMFYGGYEPQTSWTRHWSPAVEFDVGQPTGTWSEFASGNDPANANLVYKVFGRNYTDALVLYKPLSYKSGSGGGTGTTADATATTHALDGTYRPLNADGSLGAPVTSVTLRNGEGAILVRS